MTSTKPKYLPRDPQPRANAKYSYRPSRSYINGDRPRIRRMVSQLVEWGFEHTEV